MVVLVYLLSNLKAIKITTLLCLLWVCKSFAQPINSSGMVSGIVVDSASHTPLSHVSVEIEEIEKGTVLRSTFTNKNGFFSFTNLPTRNPYQLKLTYTGYRTFLIATPGLSSSSPIHLGELPLVSVSELLKEVYVSAQKPILQQDINKILYNVDADPESKTASALDILSKIPMLTVDAEDNLQMNGNSNYKVLINGKPSTLFRGNPGEMFKNLPASMIKSVEVMNSPTAKYEAAGIGGIINIITYKKIISGFNGGVNLRRSHPEGLSTNGNLTVRTRKLSLSTNLGRSSRTNPGSSNTFSREDKLHNNILDQKGSNESNGRFYNGGGEASLELNEQNLMTASYSMTKDHSNSESSQLVAFLDSVKSPKELYQTLNTGANKSHGNDVSFDYQRSSSKNAARQLTLSYSYSKSVSNSFMDSRVLPLLNHKKQSSVSSNDDVLKEQNLKVDYAQPIKEHLLELGASTINRKSNSSYFYETLDTATGAFVRDTVQSNSFSYRESIQAGYASFQLHLHLWGIQAGARLERANLDAQFSTFGTPTRKEYANLVPTITVSRRLKGASSLKLSYTQRIQRPDLYYLDPYIDLTDPYNISYGNPDLKPALAHVVTLVYQTYFDKTSININILHQTTNNSIQQFTVLGADTISRTTFGNIGRNQNTSFSLGINKTLFQLWNLNLNGNANYIEYSSIINGKDHTNKGLTYSTSASVNLRLKTWRFGSSMSYNAPNVLAQGETAGYTANSAILNKYFLKNNKVNIGLSVSSLFHEHRRSYTEINDPSFYLRRESLSIIRRYNLSLNYRFAKLQGSESGKREK